MAKNYRDRGLSTQLPHTHFDSCCELFHHSQLSFALATNDCNGCNVTSLEEIVENVIITRKIDSNMDTYL